MILNTAHAKISPQTMPAFCGRNRFNSVKRRCVSRRSRSRKDLVALGRALLALRAYPDARVIDEVAAVLSRRVFGHAGAA